ncbi:hypothetical protein ACHAXA_008357 [Cyclostephanos tholiformis]|uniref:Uncharacterized protein n=1 Tax=Cyclostephanos tholiformis TaxID=382380 RepID=A0ABD3RVZ9_9STRA
MLTSSKRIAEIAVAVSLPLAALTNFRVAAEINRRVVSSLADLPFDDNGHLSSHVLAYLASDPCSALVEAELPDEENMYHHIPIAVEGDAADALFGDRPPSESPIVDVKHCPAVCLVRGVDLSLAAYPLPEKYYDPENNVEHASFQNFVSSWSCGRVEFAFINYSPKTLSMYWVDGNGAKTYLYRFERKEKNTRFVETYIGHRFTAEDPDTGEVLMDHTVEFSGAIGVSNHENYIDPTVDIREQVRRESDGMWNAHLQVKRTFTSLGFNKGRLPGDVFASMRAFYYNNRDPPHRLQEEWDNKGIFVNHWEADCNFIMVPWHLKQIWQARLKDVVQEWAGCEIEQTDMYGIRQYEAGARLLTHVDRINTHAVSLIVNIAQGNLTQPWTVEVYDHANRLHEVVMEPGDIVYYESAKALHGRNTPLAGGYYANIFTHYRPIGDPQWYLKDNPEGTPEPLMDVGKCELVGKPNEYSAGAVKCENPAIGPHLSPRIFTATSGDDLYQWWLSVGPSFDNEMKGSDEL